MDSTRGPAAEAVGIHRLEVALDWPPGHAAAFLVEANEPVLVDAGVPGEEGDREFREALAEHGHTVADVEHVVLTHPHSDHIGQVPALLDGGARIYAPRATKDRLGRDPADLEAGVREVGGGTGVDDERLEEHVDRALDSLERNRRLLPPEVIDHAFEYGEPFEVAGLGFDPVHTPGHQADHAVFFCDLEGETVMFAGDALIEPFRAAALHVGLDHGAYDAIDACYEGYERLADRHADRVFPGHGPVFSAYDEVLERSRSKLDKLVRRVRETVAAIEPASPVAITHTRVPDVDHPAPLLDTVGALGTLERRGEVRYDLADGVRLYETT